MADPFLSYITPMNEYTSSFIGTCSNIKRIYSAEAAQPQYQRRDISDFNLFAGTCGTTGISSLIIFRRVGYFRTRRSYRTQAKDPARPTRLPPELPPEGDVDPILPTN